MLQNWDLKPPSQLAPVLYIGIPELSTEFLLFNFLFVPINTWTQTNHAWLKIIWSNFYFFCIFTIFLFEDLSSYFPSSFPAILFTELLTSVLSQMFPMFLIRSSMQEHRCDHILHSTSEDFEDITITHTTVSPFPRTSPLRSLQMGPVSGFLWTPLSLYTSHPCFQKCSLSSVGRGWISIYSNPCISGGQNSQRPFRYPGLKQLISRKLT